jgi:WD40 repeat protein
MQFIPGTGLDVVIDELARVGSGASTLGGSTVAAPAEHRGASVIANSLLSGIRYDTNVADPAPTCDVAEMTPSKVAASSMSGVSSSVSLPGQTDTTSASKPRKLTYWQSVARVGVQVADALAYAHRQGVLHRDVKPSNLLLDLAGTVWVTDFGLAKAQDQQNLTHTGDIIGTFRYMPPEAFDGKADARGDVYSLGLTLYELAALRPAFDEKERNKLVKQVTTTEPEAVGRVRKGVPRDLETIIHKAIDREPARRYQTAGELAADLQHFLNDEPIKARRQTTVESAWRWARQHKTVTSLVAVVLLLLVAITVGSVVAAAHFRQQEQEQRGLAQVKAALADWNQRLAEENEAAKKAAEDAQKRAEITLVDMQTARGLLAAERDDPARALLWFAKAAEEAASDPTRQADNRLRARNWARNVTVPVRAFPLNGRFVRVLEFRPGNDLLLVLADDRLFVRDWRQDRYLPWGNDVPKVGAACWSPDGEWLAIGYHSGAVQIRGVPDGRILQEVNLPGAITALAFSQDGKHLAVAGTEVRDWGSSRTVLPWDLFEEKTSTLFGEAAVHLLDLPSGTLRPGGWKHPQPVHSLAFNRAGDRLITAGMDRKARVFAVAEDPDRPAPLFDPIPHEPRYPWPPVLVEDDRWLITLSLYGTARPTELTCWDAETGKPTAGPGVIRAKPTYPPRVVASPRGDWFATAGHYGPEIWKTADPGTKSVYVSDHTGYVQDFVPSPDGKTVLSGSWDQTARLWSAPDGKPLGSPLPHMGRVTRCAIAPDNLHLATLAEDLVRVWRRCEGDVADVHPARWLGIARPSFDGQLIAPGIWHEQANAFVPIGPEQLLVLTARTGTAAGPAVALRGRLVDSCVCADNRTVAAVSEEKGSGWLSLCDVSTGQALAEPTRLPGSPRSVAARPSSSQVAVLCAGGELLVFDHRSGQQILELKHDGQSAGWRTPRVEYTADGSTLVALVHGKEDVIHILDAATGLPRCPPVRPVLKDGPCRSFALSADSRLLATAVNGKNAAQVWDLATGRALSQPLPHPGDHYGLFCLCFSPDGLRLLTGGTDGQARLWDWQAAVLACPPLKHNDQVLSVAMTPDGRFALTAGRSLASTLHVWELTTGRLVAPKIQLPTNAIASLACSPTESRIVACSPHVGLVARIDLARVLAPAEMPIEDYRLLGELASGQRIEQGDESGLTQDEWLERLNRFNQRQPAYGRPAPAGAVVPPNQP